MRNKSYRVLTGANLVISSVEYSAIKAAVLDGLEQMRRFDAIGAREIRDRARYF